MPWSLWWFVLTAVVYLIQLPSIPGVALMFVGASLWSIATVNLGFLSLVVEVATRRISRVWLVLPIAWFGGYAAFAAASHLMAFNLDAGLRRDNDSRTFPFDPAAQALVIDARGSPQGRRVLSDVSGALIRGFDLPIVYEMERDTSRPGGVATRARLVVSEDTCRRVLKDQRYRAIGVMPNWPAIGVYGRPGKERCVLSAPLDPLLPVVTVAVQRVEESAILPLPHSLFHLTITDHRGTTGEWVVGQAAPYRWLPLPVMGCSLNSAQPAWVCFSGFMRERIKSLGGDGAAGAAGGAAYVISRALGLTASAMQDRQLAAEASTMAMLDGILAPQQRRALAILDKALANPSMRINSHDVAVLAGDSSRWRDRVDAIVAAIGVSFDRRAATGRAGDFTVPSTLQRLIETLPPDVFARVGPELLASLGKGMEFGEKALNQGLIARLGELGEPAMPLLERFAFGPPSGLSAAALSGLCRVGAPAARLAERVAEVLRTTTRGRDAKVHRTAYVTLLRLGRADLADIDPDAAARLSPGEAKQYADWRTSVTRESPPAVCSP